VSIEPMLSDTHFHSRWLNGYHYESGPFTNDVRQVKNNSLDWVIIGGESGPGARPMQIAWARSLVEQCKDAGVPVFVKQLGGRVDKRSDPALWPEDLRVREYPRG